MRFAVVSLTGSGANPRRLQARTPLHRAAREGYAKVVAALLSAKADAGVKDTDGQTPLELAEDHKRTTAAAALKAVTNNEPK